MNKTLEKIVKEILSKADILSLITKEDKNYDEYNHEAERILFYLPYISNKENLQKLIYYLFLSSFGEIAFQNTTMETYKNITEDIWKETNTISHSFDIKKAPLKSFFPQADIGNFILGNSYKPIDISATKGATEGETIIKESASPFAYLLWYVAKKRECITIEPRSKNNPSGIYFATFPKVVKTTADLTENVRPIIQLLKESCAGINI